MKFKAIKITERLPNFNERIFFFDNNYKDTFIKEYNPLEEIEIKKGKFIKMKECETAINYLINNFTHWLELENNLK